MTLDEAIKRAEEVAKEKQLKAHDLKQCKDYGNPKSTITSGVVKCEACADEHKQLVGWLKELKAYKEQEPCVDAISRDELLKNQTVIIDDDGLAHKVVHIGRICAAPSVNPRLRTGKWIKHDTGHSIYYDCSLCGCTAPHIEVADKILWKLSNYCPDCGAEMEGVE